MRVLFSAKDAGGASAIVPVIRALACEGAELHGILDGPAKNIFAAADIPFEAGALGSFGIFIAGTSAGDSPDKMLMQKLAGTPSLYVLDFWINYWQRFSSADNKDFAYLPTRICIMDDIAKEEMLAEGFPSERLAVTGNPHFDHFADTVTRDHEEKERILFISQPLSSIASMPGFSGAGHDEYAALADVLAALEAIPEQYYLSLRLHPRESANKYTEYLGTRVCRATEPTLEEALSWSGLIIGISSPALMEAAAAGKKVLSYEPILAGKDSLVSNRSGVTTRIATKEALAAALAAYARGEWPFANQPLREVWPAGATERVVKEVHTLIAESRTS